jgi:hypothetical protein
MLFRLHVCTAQIRLLIFISLANEHSRAWGSKVLPSSHEHRARELFRVLTSMELMMLKEYS